MGRLREATLSNREAGPRIQRELLWKLRDRSRAATTSLKQAHHAAPDRVLEKLASFNSAHAVIEELCFELAGAAILGGMTAAEVSAATGIPTATLTRRVPKALTDLRGRHLVRDTMAPYGWRPQ